MESSFQILTETLKKGGIAVVRTDTLYGIIALAANEAAVEKVYQAKQRNLQKQCIILISKPSEVPAHADLIEKYGGYDVPPTSVIVPASTEAPWLLRGGDSMAYRLVRDPLLKRVVEAVGPVIAPSANPESMPPASTIKEAREYFGDTVDAYIDGGTVPTDVHASRIIKIGSDNTVTELRP